MSVPEQRTGHFSPAENVNSEKSARKVACTECRQQKVRCDVGSDPTQPCSRCRKFNLACTISTPFKRTPKKNKLEELEEETSRLRRKLDQVTPSASIERQQNSLPTPVIASEASANHEAPSTEKTCVHITTPQDLHAFRRPNLSGANGGYPADRVIDGLRVDSQTIVDTFGLFYEYYAPLMPIVDPTVSPDDYTRYPFVFWMIISIGSRRYTKDATLLHSLAPRVTQLALESLKEPKGRTILGLMLLITWPFPTDVSNKDITFTISAALVHIAIRMGLHMPQSVQDFHRTKIEVSERQHFKRPEVWIYCLMVYQRACCMYGAAPSAWVCSTFDFQWRHALSDLLNPALLFQFKLQRLESQANAAITENGCDKDSPDQKRGFIIILKILDRQVRDIESENPWIDDFLRFHVMITRLCIIGLHLLRPLEEVELTELMEIYKVACTIMTLLHKCDSTMHLISVCPDHLHAAVMVAGCVILRILKSEFAQYVDAKDGKAVLLDCINVLKLMSCANNDMPARYSQILAQLWTSDKVFKNPDGSPCLNLRTRSRYAISLALDCIWWWREEFGGQPGVYSKGESSSAPSNTTQPNPKPFDNPFGSEELMTLPFLDDQLWLDMDWNFDPNFALPITSATVDQTAGTSSRPSDWPSVPPATYG